MSASEIIIDSFAGGGGASAGIEMALGRSPDVAINHDPDAIAMHAVNHPDTEHHCQNVWQLDPRDVARGRPVGLAWFSPDCKHFSKAKGGKPVNRNLRDLAWVVILYAQRVKPRVIILENVEEFKTWGPLGEDGRPCKMQKGVTFQKWLRELRRAGYRVEYRELRAFHFGTPTQRKRLYLIARRDGGPIVWPDGGLDGQYGDPNQPGFADSGLLPWRTAAGCLDFSLPCPSIFWDAEQARIWCELTGQRIKRPLAAATMRRIFQGLDRWGARDPYIIKPNHKYGWFRGQPLPEPLQTVCQTNDKALVMPFLTKYRTGSSGSPVNEPWPTITANSYEKRPGGNPPLALVSAFLAKHFGGNETPGWPLSKPISTITTRDHHNLVTTNLVKLRGTCRHGQPVTQPMATVTAGGNHIGEVRAFLQKYYGCETSQQQDCREPLHSIRTKDAFGLVTVHGVDYQIVDIGMRMLTPRELFRAQGFPDDYIIDRGPDGRPLTKTAQVRMCGNSVCPPVAAALVRANVSLQGELRRAS